MCEMGGQMGANILNRITRGRGSHTLLFGAAIAILITGGQGLWGMESNDEEIVLYGDAGQEQAEVDEAELDVWIDGKKLGMYDQVIIGKKQICLRKEINQLLAGKTALF